MIGCAADGGRPPRCRSFGRRSDAKANDEIFFATDVHGSERTWRKFVNAAAFYGADVLVMGGDVMGKLTIPIIRSVGGRHRATIHGRVEQPRDRGRRRGEPAIGSPSLGFYDTLMDEDAYVATRDDPEAVDGLW